MGRTFVDLRKLRRALFARLPLHAAVISPSPFFGLPRRRFFGFTNDGVNGANGSIPLIGANGGQSLKSVSAMMGLNLKSNFPVHRLFFEVMLLLL